MMKKVVVASIMTAVVLMLTFTLVLPTDGEGADNYTNVTDTDPIEATLNGSHSGCGCVEAGKIIYTLDETSHTATVVNPSEHPQAELPYSTYSGEITIPSKIKYNDQEYNVTSIGPQAFCQSPKSGGGPTTVILPEGLTTIAGQAFENCTNLSSIALPTTLTTIGERTFYGCSGLNGLTIPAGVTDLGFEYRSIPGTEHANLSFGALNGWLKTPDDWSKLKFDANSPFKFDQDKKVLYKTKESEKELMYLINEDLTEFTVGSDVTAIGAGAFYDKTKLTTISFEDESSLKKIGVGAFGGCSALGSLSFPANVDLSISVEAPFGMGALIDWLDGTKNVELNNQEYKVEDGAFYCGTALIQVFNADIENLAILDGTTAIRSNAFDHCMNLQTVTIPESLVMPIARDLYGMVGSKLKVTGDPDNEYTIEDDLLYKANNTGKTLIMALDEYYLSYVDYCVRQFENDTAPSMTPDGFMRW